MEKLSSKYYHRSLRNFENAVKFSSLALYCLWHWSELEKARNFKNNSLDSSGKWLSWIHYVLRRLWFGDVHESSSHPFDLLNGKLLSGSIINNGMELPATWNAFFRYHVFIGVASLGQRETESNRNRGKITVFVFLKNYFGRQCCISTLNSIQILKFEGTRVFSPDAGINPRESRNSTLDNNW